MRTTEIKIKVSLDENNLPIHMEWEAEDGREKGECKSVMLSMWDSARQNSLRIDLWTKDMPVEEMKKFFHQNLLLMGDMFLRATGEEKIVGDLRDYCDHFAEKMNLIEQNQ